MSQPADALGGFLEGAFAPLAFLSLVIGSFLQQRELRHNNRAIQAQYEQMKRSAESAEVQAEAIRANALHQQQETVMMVADRVHRQLGSVVGLLWMSSQAPTDDPATNTRVEELWNQFGGGDPEGFTRQFIALHFRNDREHARDLLFGTEIRAMHSRTIIEFYGRLLDKVRECDPDGSIETALLGSGHGRLYRIIRDHAPAAAG